MKLNELNELHGMDVTNRKQFIHDFVSRIQFHFSECSENEWMKELSMPKAMAAAAIQFHYTKWMKVEWNGEAGETEWFIQFNRSINSTRWNWIDGGLKWIEHEVN